ncbi:MAG TPA: hypothetical protein VKV15_21500 [Bryobacteraceae bacterium]|nr:hypothetical protein [Bryobacteraceae bacterium]
MQRRSFLTSPIALASGRAASPPGGRPRIAAILNVYFPNSHADVFVGRLLGCYRLNGKTYQPRVDVAAFYVDQFPIDDMAREQGEEYKIPIYSSVPEALRLGGHRLAVDGIAVIGEHGNYPRTPRGNFMYPRWRYFEQITSVFREDGRVVPLYNDKYFAYEWADARKMYDRIRAMKIPCMAGSTLPLTWRRPPLEFPRGIQLDEVLAVSCSDLEEHAYHGIELMQAMAEVRRGGETGVEAVRCIENEAVWKSGERGEWSQELLNAALTRRVNPVTEDRKAPAQAIQVRYKDGLKGTILNLNGLTRDYLFAARVKGHSEPYSSCFYIELYNHNHWSFMVRNFEQLVLTGKETNPIERTLLANGIMLFGLESRLRGHEWLDTAQLDIHY